MRRYPGVAPFSSEQQELFYGRKKDINALQKLIALRDQVLLYSKSGIGKTSILNAGVLPKLKDKYVIVSVRFTLYDKKSYISPVERIVSSLQKAIGFSEVTDNPLPELFDKYHFEKNLWYHFKSTQLNLKNRKRVLLVFDQFEELFSYPDEDILQFKNDYYNLTKVDIPDSIMQHIEDIEEQNEEDLLDLLSQPTKIQSVFSIRSDQLSYLNLLSDKIPDIQLHYYELKPLREEDAKHAICGPAEMEGNYESPKFSVDSAINKIIDELTQHGTQPIESTLLQKICEEIEIKAQIKDKSRRRKKAHELLQITPDDLPEFRNIFLNFYINAIHDLPKDQQQQAKKLIEYELIRNERRISLDEEICKEYINTVCLKIMVDKHLLSSEINAFGRLSFEISHDSLINPIIEVKKIREEKEEEEKADREHLEEIKRLKEEKEKHRKLMIVVIGAIIFLLSVTIFSLIQTFNYRKAKQEVAHNTKLYFESEAKRLFSSKEYEGAHKYFEYILNEELYPNSIEQNKYLKMIDSCYSMQSLKRQHDSLLVLADSVFMLYEEQHTNAYKKRTDYLVGSYIIYKETQKINFPHSQNTGNRIKTLLDIKNELENEIYVLIAMAKDLNENDKVKVYKSYLDTLNQGM